MSDRLRDTQIAFDSVAADYDGQRGNNELIQDMRSEMWRWLDATFTPRSRLIDIGCGTGLDAIRMGQHGHHVTAIDWSPHMVARTADRARCAGLSESVRAVPIGAQELDRLAGNGIYDGAYSNLGPLNCVPGLAGVSRECARLLKPGAALVFTVIGRMCPWEMGYYICTGRWSRARIRYARDFVAVGMNRRTIWTRYYWPREFYRCFQREFALQEYRGLCTFTPPPYLTWMRDRHPRWHERLWALDRRASGLPLLRNMGDHFLMVMRRRE